VWWEIALLFCVAEKKLEANPHWRKYIWLLLCLVSTPSKRARSVLAVCVRLAVRRHQHYACVPQFEQPMVYENCVVQETCLYFTMDANPKLGWALYHPLHVSLAPDM